MTLTKRTQNEILPGFSNGLFFKDLIDWPQARNYGNETAFPAINVKETEKEFVVEVAAPGLTKEDFSIEIENQVLSISFLKKEEDKKEEAHRYFLKEFSTQSFKRSFKLAENKIETEKIEATYTNGVLVISLPKRAEKTEKVKQIKVV